jgi:hypothetical protein
MYALTPSVANRIWHGRSAHDSIEKQSIGCTEAERLHVTLWETFASEETVRAQREQAVVVEPMFERFSRNVQEMITTAHKEKKDMHGALVELKAYKAAEDVGFADCTAALMPVVMKLMALEKEDKLSIQKECTQILKHWSEMLKWMVESPPEEMIALKEIERFCCELKRSGKPENVVVMVFRYTLQTMEGMLEVLDGFNITKRSAEVLDSTTDDAEERSDHYLFESKWLYEAPLMDEYLEYLEQDSDEDEVRERPKLYSGGIRETVVLLYSACQFLFLE